MYGGLDSYFTSRFHHQLSLRFLNSKELEDISEVVDPLIDGGRGGLNVELALKQMLAWQGARLEACDMLSDRNQMPVFAGGAMYDSVDHKPTVIGKMRAWLKYLLDRLLDQEGRRCSKPLRKRSRRTSPLAAFAMGFAPGSG